MIAWFSGNASGYIAHETRSFARSLGLMRPVPEFW